MASRGTAVFGRLLTTIGVLWMVWAVVTGFVGISPDGSDISLPFLPGLLFFLFGRAMVRAGRRRPLEEPVGTGSPESPPRPRPRPAVTSRSNRPVTPALPPASEPEAETQVFTEALEAVVPDLEEAIADTPPPMSSDEMVAEAKRRWGPRREDEEESGV